MTTPDATPLYRPHREGASLLERGCPVNSGTSRVCQKELSGPQIGPVPAENHQVTSVDGTQS